MSRTNPIIKKYNYMFGLMEDSRYPISFGFECGYGWLSILSRLFDDIAKIDKKKEVTVFQVKEKYGSLRVYLDSYPSPNRFEKILMWMCYKYSSMIRFLTRILGIKWKFYKLYKYYIPKKQRQIQKLIDKAEEESIRTCETCGSRNNAEIKSDEGWLSCQCEFCRNPVALSEWYRYDDELPEVGSKVEYKQSIDYPYSYIIVYRDSMPFDRNTDCVWRYIK